MRPISAYLQQVRWSSADIVAEALQAQCVPAPVKVEAGGEHLVVEGEINEEAALCQHCQHQPCAGTAVCSPVYNLCRHAGRQLKSGNNSGVEQSSICDCLMEGQYIMLPATT